MENTSLLVISLSFFVVFIVYGIFAFYILKMSAKSCLNRLFFAICIALSIWSFGFAIAISASTMEGSIFWRRFSAIGWGPMYSLLMHFVLILTGKNNLLKKKWIYPLLYAPAILNDFVFALPTPINTAQYNMVHSSAGWVNIAVNTPWDWFYLLYVISFSIITLILIWKWGHNTEDAFQKKQAKVIFGSLCFAFIFATFSDIVINAFFSAAIPQIAPLIIILPITAFYYLIRRWGLMNPKQAVQYEKILTISTRAKVFNYISFSFLAGALLYFASHYLFYRQAGIATILQFTLYLACVGVAIQIVQHIKLKESMKEILNIAVISAMIPFITLQYVNDASVTIWAFPFILIIFSLVFNRRIVIVALSASILLTQILVWVIKPAPTTTTIDSVDHIGRIGLYCITIFVAFFINNVYIKRLQENADQIRLQKTVSEISSDFVTARQSNIDEKINQTLKKLGELFKMDSAFLFLFNADGMSGTRSHQWTNEIAANDSSFDSIEKYPWFIKQIHANEVIQIYDLEHLSSLTKKERALLQQIGIQSLIAIPVSRQSQAAGYICLFSKQSKSKFTGPHIRVLQVIANILSDAIAKTEAEKEISYMAYYDHLTGLPNRLLFKDRASQAASLARRTEKLIGILFLDLDSFKTVNDTLGHEAGDKLLQSVAEVLSDNVRKSDTVSRFGGDEFLIMINNIAKIADIPRIADNIMAQFAKPFTINNQEFFITASAGISVFPTDGEDMETLIKNADIAMYSAKARGKNQFILCSSNMKEEVQTKMKLTNGLYRALEHDELELFYQPQVCLRTAKIIGVEALIRWNHPELGIISPGSFISLSEQTGLINPIGEWVLRTACAQNKRWQEEGFPQIRMSVNVSVVQFRNPALVRQVKDILLETNLDPACLELEITEGIAINESNYIIDVLNNLKSLGISLSIDDFGTEYSSLSRLKILPIDRIKMDMQFMHGIETSEKDQAIAGVIIHLAKSLGINVIAEGVETREQLDFLIKKECDEAQGFYYHKPMTASEAEQILKQDIDKI